jgi:hypothetical protein
MNKFLKLKGKMEVIMAPDMEVYKDMQKKAEQSKINSYMKFPVSHSIMHSSLVDGHDSFYSGAPLFHYTSTPILLCLLIINLHIIIFVHFGP